MNFRFEKIYMNYQLKKLISSEVFSFEKKMSQILALFLIDITADCTLIIFGKREFCVVQTDNTKFLNTSNYFLLNISNSKLKIAR